VRADEWENPQLDRYLEALAGWLTDAVPSEALEWDVTTVEGPLTIRVPKFAEEASWQLFAIALYAASIYE
jgi:hypothetical protein